MVHQCLFATGGGGALQRASPSGAGISHEPKKKQVLRQKILGAQFAATPPLKLISTKPTGRHNLF
jgi:hypothetical protein